MNPLDPDPLKAFVRLSAALTGFNAAELHGSGMVRPYWDFMSRIAGEHGMGRLLDVDARSHTAASGCSCPTTGATATAPTRRTRSIT